MATDFSVHNAIDSKYPFDNTIEATRIEGDSYFSKAVFINEGGNCSIAGTANLGFTQLLTKSLILRLNKI